MRDPLDPGQAVAIDAALEAGWERALWDRRVVRWRLRSGLAHVVTVGVGWAYVDAARGASAALDRNPTTRAMSLPEAWRDLAARLGDR